MGLGWFGICVHLRNLRSSILGLGDSRALRSWMWAASKRAACMRPHRDQLMPMLGGTDIAWAGDAQR